MLCWDLTVFMIVLDFVGRRSRGIFRGVLGSGKNRDILLLIGYALMFKIAVLMSADSVATAMWFGSFLLFV